MRNAKLLAVAMLALTVGACGNKGVEGKYTCNGIPGKDKLELAADGTYQSTGAIMSAPTSASGRYTVDDAHVTLKGTEVVPSISHYSGDNMVFDRRDNGDLKWILAFCKRA
jgi:hypothetical protein